MFGPYTDFGKQKYRGCTISVMGIDSINCQTTNTGVEIFSNKCPLSVLGQEYKGCSKCVPLYGFWN